MLTSILYFRKNYIPKVCNILMWKITRFSSKEWKSWESSPQSRHVPWEGTKPWLSGSYVEAKLLSHSDRTLFSILALCTLDFPCRHSLCWASQDNLRVWWLVISHRIQHVVMLMGKIYYTKGYKNKIGKRKKVYGAKSRGSQPQASESPLPMELSGCP